MNRPIGQATPTVEELEAENEQLEQRIAQLEGYYDQREIDAAKAEGELIALQFKYAQLQARLDAVANRTCEWKPDNSRLDRVYWGECGSFFEFTDDMKYCPHCGGKITQALGGDDE